MKSRFIDFYVGSEVQITILKGLLEEVGIFGIIQNDFSSGNLAGFVGGTPDTVQFKIRNEDMESAKPILEKFLNSNQNPNKLK